MNIYQFEIKIKDGKHCQEKVRKEMYIVKGERKQEKRRKRNRERKRERSKKNRVMIKIEDEDDRGVAKLANWKREKDYIFK